eukprot:1535688-Rhodomonas_salina.2
MRSVCSCAAAAAAARAARCVSRILHSAACYLESLRKCSRSICCFCILFFAAAQVASRQRALSSRRLFSAKMCLDSMTMSSKARARRRASSCSPVPRSV